MSSFQRAAGGSASDPRLVEAISMVAAVRINIPEQLEAHVGRVTIFLFFRSCIYGECKFVQSARTLATEFADPLATIDSLLIIGTCAADTGGLAIAMEVSVGWTSTGKGSR